MTEVTGVIKNAVRATSPIRGTHLYGQIYGDTLERFYDGEWVHTSTIMEELPDNVFRTRYSTYKVEFAEGASA